MGTALRGDDLRAAIVDRLTGPQPMAVGGPSNGTLQASNAPDASRNADPMQRFALLASMMSPQPATAPVLAPQVPDMRIGR
jgi:hypothetical protein